MSESVSILRRNTYKLFFKSSFLYALIIFFNVLFTFRSDIINPDFMSVYLVNQFICDFVNKFFINIWTFIFLNYALFFKNDLTYTTGGRRLIFSKIISSGLNIVIVSSVLFFIFSEFLTPHLRSNVVNIKEQSSLASILLLTADEYYNEGNYIDALSTYEKYQIIIKPNRVIREKMRTLRHMIYSKQPDGAENKINVPDNLNTYIDIADYFYREEDYFSAWFYYQYVGDSNPVDRRKALNRIENIKQILTFRNSLMTDSMRIEFIDNNTRKIRALYNSISEADGYFSRGDYFNSYHAYRNINMKYPNIREVSQGMNESFNYIRAGYVNLDDVRESFYFPSHSNFVIFYKSNLILKASKVVKTIDTGSMRERYFFYDLYLYELESGEVTQIIYSKYGEFKNSGISLISFSPDDKNEVFYPVFKKVKKERLSVLFPDLNIYDFYTDSGSFYDIKSISEGDLKRAGKLFSEVKLADYIDNGAIEFNFDMGLLYNVRYDREGDSAFSIFDLLKLRDGFRNIGTQTGISLKFVSILIAERIARVFMLLVFSLLLLSVSFRYRVTDYKTKYLFIIPAVVFLFYFTEQVILYFNSIFITAFSNIFDIAGLSAFVIIISFIIMSVSIVYVSATEVE